MRRTILHISLALVTFSISFLTVSKLVNLPAALCVAFIAILLLKKAITLRPNFHQIKVVTLTLLIWIPFAVFTLNVALPHAWTCEIDLSDEEMNSLKEVDRVETVTLSTAPEFDSFDKRDDASFGSYNPTSDFTSNTIWAGIIDNKAVSKPAPEYPPLARVKGIASTIAVAVVVDPSGRVIAAEDISGHPLLREAAVEAAYQARFSPSKLTGVPLNVSGVLTYRFGF